jgi:hypothetical protein
MELKPYDEVRLNIELPADVRRQLARRSLALGVDLSTLIRQILQEKCEWEESGL